MSADAPEPGDDYLWDRSGDDPDVRRLEALLAPLAHRGELGRRRRRWPRFAVAGAVVVAAAAAAIAIYVARAPGAPGCSGSTGFAFTARGGEVTCGGAEVAAGVLPVGGSLDTGSHEADLDIAKIGHAQLGPQTLVRLDRTSASGHRMWLERGRMHAKVDAPPRLFEVATPSAEVTDLGCEYTLEIGTDPAHRDDGRVVVQTGRVELATGHGAVVIVPARSHAAILDGHRPGLPIDDGATPELEAAVHAFEAVAGDPGQASAIATVLALARPSDAITVVNLAVVADRSNRHAILVRLAQLSSPPGGITVDDADAPAMFGLWMDDVVVRQQTNAGTRTPD